MDYDYRDVNGQTVKKTEAEWVYIDKYCIWNGNEFVESLSKHKVYKFNELKASKEKYRENHIKFTRDGNTFFVKFNDNTQKEALGKYNAINDSVAEVLPVWYADYINEDVEQKMTKVTFNDLDQTLSFLRALGGVYQTSCGSFLDVECLIESAETIEAVQAIVIPDGSLLQADIGGFDNGEV